MYGCFNDLVDLSHLNAIVKCILGYVTVFRYCCRDGFRLLVISSVDPYKYEELLADSIPLGYMTPIYINH